MELTIFLSSIFLAFIFGFFWMLLITTFMNSRRKKTKTENNEDTFDVWSTRYFWKDENEK